MRLASSQRHTLQWRNGCIAVPAAKAAGRRRTRLLSTIAHATYSSQGSNPLGPGAGSPGPRDPGVARRVFRRPRDLQQLVDVLAGGAMEDPEQFLQLIDTAPRVLVRRRLSPRPPPSSDPTAADVAERQRRQQLLQQLQQQQQQAAAAGAEAAMRRAAQLQLQQQQQEEEEEEEAEEKRREVVRAAMLQNARRHLPRYDAPAMARLASALAAMGVQDPALCDEMVRQLVSQQAWAQQQQHQQQQLQKRQQQQQPAVQRRRAPEPRSIAELLDAFAAMRHRPSDAELGELLRLQELQQQQAEMELARQQQLQQQQLAQRSQPRLQPRGMGIPAAPLVAAAAKSAWRGGTDIGSSSSSSMSPDDAARLLHALSRVGYSPDERTLTRLLEQLQPQRLQLQPTAPPVPATAAPTPGSVASGGGTEHDHQQPSTRLDEREGNVDDEELQLRRRQQQQRQTSEQARGAAAAAAAAAAAPTTVAHEGLQGAVMGEEAEAGEDFEGEEEEDDDQLSYSLQRDAQAVASAVRALERMGRPDRAQQLRQRFKQHVEEVQARVVRERQARRQEAAAAAAKREWERERQAAAEAATAAEQQRRLRELREQSEAQRRQRQEEQTWALRAQLSRKLRTADTWQQIRVLLFTYQEALDAECLVAAAARLGELLAAVRRRGRGLGGGWDLRERGELGDLLEGLGELVVGRLESTSAAQAASLLTSVVRMRHLEERLVVGLLRRLRDTLGEAAPGDLAAALGALADCSVRPSAPWMETFLARCEDMLEKFTPDDLEVLPVCLAQLGAHPGRSWLGSYLDVLQEREAELSQSAVAEAVRAVAVLDRQFLSAWRQAAAVRQQQQLQLQQQAQAQAQAAAAVTQQRAQQLQQQQQQQQQARQAADALASVDEMLAHPELQPAQPYETGQAALPPMHPRQRSMAQQTQHDENAARQEQSSDHEKGPTPSSKDSGRRVGVPAMQSIELDVDTAGLSYGSGADASTSEPVPEAPAAGKIFSSGPQAGNSRQLPGSYSIDGYYNLIPYDKDYYFEEDTDDDEEQEDDEVEESLILDEAVAESLREEEAAGGASVERPEGAATVGSEGLKQASTAAAGLEQPLPPSQPPQQGQQQRKAVDKSHMFANLEPSLKAGPVQTPTSQEEAGREDKEASGAATSSRQQKYQGQQAQQQRPPAWESEGQEQGQAEQPEAGTEVEGLPDRGPQRKAEPTQKELAQARALRSLLLERYEAVAAFKDELEARKESGEGLPITGEEAAAAARYLTAREQLQRLQADFDNFKRREELELEQASARVKAEVIKPLLAVADNFERASAQIKPHTDGEHTVHGAYQAVYGELKQLLKKLGVEPLGAAGEKFDPNQHEAVMREDRNDVDDGTITGVFQKGYRLGDVLIRPALVKVAYS